MNNNCARVTIPDAAVVKIVCGTQEGHFSVRSELHPDDTDGLGSPDWPPTRHSRTEKELRSFAFTSLDKKATQRQAAYWSPSHCDGEGSSQCSSHIYSCLIQSFIWAQMAKLLRASKSLGSNAYALLTARCRTPLAAYVETCNICFWPIAWVFVLLTWRRVHLFTY